MHFIRLPMKLIRLLRSARPEANLFAASATTLLVLKVLVLNRFPAFFSGAYELGLIVERILASIAASYVFYLLVVHLKAQSDKAAVQPYIAKHTTRVVGDCHSQLLEISRLTGVDISLANATIELVTDAFKKIAPHSDAPLIISPAVHANWFQYFYHHRIRTRQSISRLFSQLAYIDAELVSLLAAVDDCSHFSQIEMMQNINVKNKDLSAWASTFYGYCDLCRKLNVYREKHELGPPLEY
jgi:hypothetical protein